MALLASEIYARARSFLDDPNGEVATDTVVLAALQDANDELEDLLGIYGFGTLSKIGVDKSIPAGTTSFVPLPTDFFFPLKLEEKEEGHTDDSFLTMVERDFEPSETPQVQLSYWVFRDGQIKFRAASSNRVVRLFYTRTITEITDPNSFYELKGARRFLSARTAEIIARDTMNNELKADKIMLRVLNSKNDLETRIAMNSQGIRARRRRHNSRRIYYG